MSTPSLLKLSQQNVASLTTGSNSCFLELALYTDIQYSGRVRDTFKMVSKTSQSAPFSPVFRRRKWSCSSSCGFNPGSLHLRPLRKNGPLSA